MPSPILATGAGAGKGLEELLARLREEEQLAQSGQQVAESKRSHLADEDYRNRALTQTGEIQRATEADRVSNQRTQATNQERDDLRANLDKLPGGTDIQPTTMVSALKLRAATPERFDQKIQDPNFEGPLRPEDPKPGQSIIKLRPNVEEKLAQERIDKPAAVSPGTLKEDDKGQIVRVHPDGTVEDIFDKGGQPLKAGHFVAPDRAVVNTAGGIVPRSDATAAAKNGAPMQPQATAATRTMQEGAGMLKPHITELRDQAAELDKAGLFGPMMSRVRHAAEKVGTLDELANVLNKEADSTKDAAIGRFAATLGLMATGAGRVHGGARGGGSPQMLEHFKAMLSDSGSLPMFLGRLDALDSFMNTYAGGPPAAGGGGNVDLIFDPKTGEFRKP